jgi:mono/diheme cytochrome c family protein
MTKYSFRRNIFLWLAVALVLNFVLAFAQNTNGVADEHDHLHRYDYAELARVPQKALARRNPLEADSNAVAAGKKLFAQHCAECHGDTAAGGYKAPSLRAQEVQKATPGALFWILTNGVVRRGMPVWSKLPEPQRWQIVTFVRSLGAAPETPAPAVQEPIR